jgi:UDP-N-acetylmuramate: L-alanyl-gamma-D-glutamyl-meso-diaminopimelate ligase
MMQFDNTPSHLLDPALNHAPPRVRSVHLIAACGTAMGALAVMLQRMGLAVTGSDRQIYPPMSTFLAEHGIRLHQGFAAGHLQPPPDLVIVGNAVSRDNPEAQALAALRLPYLSMPQAVLHFAAAGREILLVAGTHGKTTTSALLAWVLQHAGLDPSFLIGGILKNFDSNFRSGQGRYIVLEGDEYDTAFFDKGPKFLHYPPRVAIVTGVEFDHADIYRDLAHVRESFAALVSRAQPSCLLLAHTPDEVIDSLLPAARCRVQRYGTLAEAAWQGLEATLALPWTRFTVSHQGRLFGRFASPLPGEHNLANTLAVIGACHELGIDSATIAAALAGFEGVRRRQELRGVARGVMVMDDFAHHPTAVSATIAAMRPLAAAGRLLAVFEPRSNTTMRRVFQDVYPAAFDGADCVLVRHPSRLDKIPPAERFSAQRLVEDIRRRGGCADFFPDTDSIIEHLDRTARAGDVILVMSNGGFDNIHQRLLDRLAVSDG